MSGYFDNQYGGDDDEQIIGGDDSDSSSDESSIVGGGNEDTLAIVEDEEDEQEEDEEEEDDDEDEKEDDDEDEDVKYGGAGEDLEEGEVDEEAEEAEKKIKRTKKVPAKAVYKKPISDDEEDDEDDEDGEIYLQKFDQSINDNYIVNFHPESVLQNYDEILAMVKVIRDKNGIIVDDLHKTIPYLTKYERARILGQRAKQINAGSPAFIKAPESVIDGYLIAELELKEKRIPFIIRRPLPNGGSEYWSLKDLEDISF
jgi:DNA-directed RNA polymerase I, II, and III subunit RPABC2